MLSYVVIYPRMFVMFVLPSYVVIIGPPFPYPFVLMYVDIVLHCVVVWVCLGIDMFGHVIFLFCLGMNV